MSLIMKRRGCGWSDEFLIEVISELACYCAMALDSPRWSADGRSRPSRPNSARIDGLDRLLELRLERHGLREGLVESAQVGRLDLLQPIAPRLEPRAEFGLSDHPGRLARADVLF